MRTAISTSGFSVEHIGVPTTLGVTAQAIPRIWELFIGQTPIMDMRGEVLCFKTFISPKPSASLTHTTPIWLKHTVFVARKCNLNKNPNFVKDGLELTPNGHPLLIVTI